VQEISEVTPTNIYSTSEDYSTPLRNPRLGKAEGSACVLNGHARHPLEEQQIPDTIC